MSGIVGLSPDYVVGLKPTWTEPFLDELQCSWCIERSAGVDVQSDEALLSQRVDGNA